MMMKLPLCLYYGNQIEVKQTEENGENGVDTLLDDTGCTTTGERQEDRDRWLTIIKTILIFMKKKIHFDLFRSSFRLKFIQ